MAVPQTVSVPLGELDAGIYNIKTNVDLNFPNKTSSMEIEEPQTDSIDNFTYANVERVERIKNTRNVKLIGSNPSNCLELDRVEYISNDKNVIAILPIMKKVTNVCPEIETPFEYIVEIPEALNADKILLHVRSLAGNVVNYVFDNK